MPAAFPTYCLPTACLLLLLLAYLLPATAALLLPVACYCDCCLCHCCRCCCWRRCFCLPAAMLLLILLLTLRMSLMPRPLTSAAAAAVTTSFFSHTLTKGATTCQLLFWSCWMSGAIQIGCHLDWMPEAIQIGCQSHPVLSVEVAAKLREQVVHPHTHAKTPPSAIVSTHVHVVSLPPAAGSLPPAAGATFSNHLCKHVLCLPVISL